MSLPVTRSESIDLTTRILEEPPERYLLNVVANTSGWSHSEFVRLLFLQTHRETDRFFASSGVQFA